MTFLLRNIYRRIDRLVGWFGRTPARCALGVSLLFAGSLAAVFFPALSGNVFAHTRFVFVFHYAMMTFFAHQIQQGILPLWGEMLNGFPVFFSSEWGFLHPFNALFAFFDPIAFYDWLIYINFFLGGIVAYMLGGEMRFSRAASIVLGAVYIFAEPNMFWGPINAFSYFIPFLPLLFLLLLRFRRRANAGFAVAAGAANIAIVLASSLTQLVLYSVVVVFLFALFLDIKNFRRSASVFGNFRSTLYVVSVVGIGTILVSPWLFSTLNFLPETIREGGIAPELAKLSFMRLGDVTGLFSPLMKMPEGISKALGIGGLSTLYFGAFPLILAVLAFFLPRKDHITAFFLWLGVFAFLAQLEFTHLFLLINKLPLFRLFRGVDKWLYFGHFSFAIVGAYVLDNIGTLKDATFRRILKGLSVLAVAAFLAIAAFTAAVHFFEPRLLRSAYAFFDARFFDPSHGLPLAYYHERMLLLFSRLRDTFSFSAPSVGFALAFFALPIALLEAIRRKLLTEALFKQLSVLTVFVSAILLYGSYYHFLPVRTLKETPAVAAFLQNRKTEEQPFRTSRILLDYYHDMLDDDPEGKADKIFDAQTLRPNLSFLYGIDTASGQSNVASSRQTRVEEMLASGKLAIEDAATGSADIARAAKVFPYIAVPDAERRLRTYQLSKTRQLLGMQNVKYLLAPVPSIAGWKKVFETAIIARNIPVFIYENPEVLPRVYVVHTPVFISTKEEALQRLLAIDDFKKETLIECDDDYCANLRQSPPAGNENLTTEEMREGYLRVRTHTTRPHWLVYSESNLPTWEARIDGVLTPIYTANYLFQAIYIPSGEHEVEFRYPGVMTQFRYAFRNLLN